VFWQVGKHYWRATPEEPYLEVPLMRHDPNTLVWGSPLWILHALSGVKKMQTMTTESVRDVETERLALQIDVESAQRCNDVALGLPAFRAEEFSAEVWLDAGGLVRWVSGRWPSFRRRDRATWVQTEFRDFGVSVDHLDRPGDSAGRGLAG
jgi:hypothetical protein